MSGIDDYKITDTTGYKVGDLPGTTLSGSVQENKEVFDSLGLLTISKFNSLIDYLKTNVVNELIDIDTVYPVGSIYMSINSTNPTSLFGGTWTQIQDRFLLACGSNYGNGATGGSADATLPSHNHSATGYTTLSGSHKHTITSTAEESGTHVHETAYRVVYAQNGSGVAIRSGPFGTGVSDVTSINVKSDGAHTHTITSTESNAGNHNHSVILTIENAGSDATGKNMPPYLAVYVWKRIA